MRYFILPSFSGITLANLGFAVYDADKFGTGTVAEVARVETEREAKEYVATQGGVLVDPPECSWAAEKPELTEAKET